MSSFSSHKPLILEKLNQEVQGLKASYPDITPWSTSVLDDLLTFINDGKGIRGSLVVQTYQDFGGNELELALLIGGALELVQAGLLIHDDIIDRDEFRRGNKAIWVKLQDQTLTEPERSHYGRSQAICVGDVAYFAAFELLSNPKIPKEIVATFARELTLVGFAEMQDVAFSRKHIKPTFQEIVTLYQYKTARYTFSLPFILGAMMANNPELISPISKLGEHIGIVFQIHDDYLGLFGVTEKTGKPVGNDIREGKKTLHMLTLLEEVTDDQNKKLISILGNSSASNEEIEYVISLMKQYKIPQKIEKIVEEHVSSATSILNTINLPEKFKTHSSELLQFILQREK